MTTTKIEITTSNIERYVETIKGLANEAASACDWSMVRDCEAALEGDEAAMRSCARVLNEAAQAQSDRRLIDSETREEIGWATPAQAEASDAAGAEGHILIDEDGDVVPEGYDGTVRGTLRRVYVEME